MAYLEIDINLEGLAETMVANMSHSQLLRFMQQLNDEAMDSKFTIQARNMFMSLSVDLEDNYNG